MRSEAPALLPIFRSQAQAELLTWLYLHPGQRFGLTDLARRAGVSLSTAHREAERLVKSQLVSESPLGRNRLLEANLDHPAAHALGQLLEVTFGPRQVVPVEFGGVPGVDRVLIFGSWAARYSGEAGHAPNDIDVMVIGDNVDRAELYAAADRAQQKLGIPVNPVMRTQSQWDDASDRLSAQVRTQSWVDVTMKGGAVIVARWRRGEEAIARLLAAREIDGINKSASDGASVLEQARRRLKIAEAALRIDRTGLTRTPTMQPTCGDRTPDPEGSAPDAGGRTQGGRGGLARPVRCRILEVQHAAATPPRTGLSHHLLQ
mgnify:CR=1 FL=1